MGAALFSTWRVGTPSASGPPSTPSPPPGTAARGPRPTCARTTCTRAPTARR
ncbi:hypothetical protein NKH77_35410 [Streptomyces sp. M19]